MSIERLIREYVHVVLQEDDASAGYSAMDIMMSDAAVGPYGMFYGSDDDIYKIFVKPFVDVVQTTAGKTKEASQKLQTLVKVAFETIVTTLVPILRDSYSEIFEKEHEHLDKIKQEYGDVYKSNWDAFKDHDVVCTAFCYAPVKFLTAKLVEKSPMAAVKMISVLSGGSLDHYLDKVKKKLDSGPPETGLNFKGPGPANSFPLESVIREDAGEGDNLAVKLLANPKVKAALQKSDVVRKMERDGRAMVRSTLEQVFKQARGVMSANSLQDLQNKTGAHLKGMDKLAQVPQQERQKAEQSILAGAKKSMKSFYLKNLEGQVKAAVDGGIPEDSPYVQDYQRVISKIKAL